MTRRLDWAEFRAPDFDGLDPERVIAVLPLAAVEQHGAHLPVGTDAMIAEGMLAALRARVPAALDLRILPVQAVGKSNEHLFAAGTLSLPAETALAAWVEIGLSVARAGIRKIALVNSHGGNLDLVSILARELRVRAGMLAVKCQWSSFGHPEGLFDPDELRFGIHGGDVETSLMLAFRPGCVAMEAAVDARSSAMAGGIPPVGPVAYGWIASDLHPGGTVGNATHATAAKGHATAAHQVDGLLALLEQMRQTSLDGLRPVPGGW